MNEAFQIRTNTKSRCGVEMMAQGTPSDMDWDLYLDSWDRQDQNAYEYMLVMQPTKARAWNSSASSFPGTHRSPAGTGGTTPAPPASP